LPGEVLRFEEASFPLASKVVLKGGLLVFPTDTVYGLGCDPFNADAVAKLFEAKRRERRPVPVLCSSADEASAIVDLGATGRELASRHWPGPLTIVAPLRAKIPVAIHQGTGAVGVRVPGLPRCRALISACGGYLAGTSANVSGARSSQTVEESRAQLGETVGLYLDGGRTGGAGSTVVEVVGNRLRVLRKGPVGVDERG
jgi:L-threonylcarbamoyladenylate synthase